MTHVHITADLIQRAGLTALDCPVAMACADAGIAVGFVDTDALYYADKAGEAMIATLPAAVTAFIKGWNEKARATAQPFAFVLP